MRGNAKPKGRETPHLRLFIHANVAHGMLPRRRLHRCRGGDVGACAFALVDPLLGVKGALTGVLLLGVLLALQPDAVIKLGVILQSTMY